MSADLHPGFTLTPDFLHGGRACFSVTTDAGRRHTFRVAHKEAEPPYPEAWFVHLQQSDERWRYLGKLSTPGRPLAFWPTAKTPAEECREAILVFRWALDHASGRSLPPEWSLNHCGRCSRCGRRLLTLESNRLGIGPECLKKLHQEDRQC